MMQPVSFLLAGACQLYFECVQKLWPTLLELQLGGQRAVSMVPFLSLTRDILKFKFGHDSCYTHDNGCRCIVNDNCSIEERSVMLCQSSIVVDICNKKILPHLLGCCSNLFEMKRCLGLFARVCSSKLVHNHYHLCDAILNTITSSSSIRNVLLNWVSLQSQSTDVQCIKELFAINATVAEAVTMEVTDADKNLLVTVVRKLTVLVIRCLSIAADGGKGMKQD